MPKKSLYGSYAESKADEAASRTGDEYRTDTLRPGSSSSGDGLLY